MNQTTWIRLYVEILNKKKVLQLSPDDFRLWVLCLCLAKSQNGRLPPVEDAAFVLRADMSAVQASLTRLQAAELVDADVDGSLWMHDWHEHQYATPAERCRQYRERKRKDEIIATGPRVVRVSREIAPDISPDDSGEFSLTPAAPVKASRPPAKGKQKKDYTPEYLEWYALFPRQEGKRPGFEQWLLLSSGKRAAALAGLKNNREAMLTRIAERGKESGCPLPATWLHQERWDDDLSAGPAPVAQVRAKPATAFDRFLAGAEEVCR